MLEASNPTPTDFTTFMETWANGVLIIMGTTPLRQAQGPQGVTNPAGATEGTRRVYRGGGWNDFGKNLRSTYRAAMPQNKNRRQKMGRV